MESIRELMRMGYGPSSSHTMAPRSAAERFSAQYPAARYCVYLYGSLAASGRGHRTDFALQQAFAPAEVEIIWQPEVVLPVHPNAMRMQALGEDGSATAERLIYSLGGGAVQEEGETLQPQAVYPLSTMNDILADCDKQGLTFWEYVEACEGDDIWAYLAEVWETMSAAIHRGIGAEGVLPGGLGLARKASSFYRKVRMGGAHMQQAGLLSTYALAVAEENAGGGKVVTAPTCGASGVLPSVLRYTSEILSSSQEILLRALATAGLIGNIVKKNASISGARVGCQGEIGVACAMAAGAAVQMMGGTNRQIEYAAEMGLEHFLGLTCDPVDGLVQIPCIERNAVAANRALNSAEYSLLTDGSHRVSFDEVVAVMNQTGHDLPSLYRETASGGLAEMVRRRTPPAAG